MDSPRVPALALVLALALALAPACGDDGRPGDSDSAASVSASASASLTDATASASASATDSGGETTAGPGSASDSQSGSTDPSATDPSATDPSTSDPSATDPSTSDPSTTGVTDSTDPATTDPEPYCGDGNVDPGEECDDGDFIDNNSCSNMCTQVPCEEQGGGGNDELLSYIWISNSSEGTVSKIDTETAVEVGRYHVEGGQPSRTSVNLRGDVAVSSRDPGGVTKIAAKEDDCVDENQNGTIETSTGPGDVLAPGTDECVLWQKPIASSGYGYGPRATAWVAGTPDPVTCEYPEPVLWVGWMDAQSTAHFLKIDGADGATIDEVTYPWGGGYSPYGGAVDKDGNFYVTGLNTQPTVKINFETMQIEDLGNPNGCKYGMTLDINGDIWSGACFGEGVYHWDHMTNTWTTLPNSGGTRVNGIMADAEGNVWGAGSAACRLVHIDVETKSYVNNSIPLPGCSNPWGVSIDYQGYVWVVDMSASKAFKVDPDTYQVVAEVTGLVGPYTYSDMTGVALKQQAVIPE